ncbi:hypothetical protein OROGR_022205 [Orobanche gracilis]
MSGTIAVESPSASVRRRQPLLTVTTATETNVKNVRRRGSRMGETAGECAAVCCCCPCAMAHLLILAVYRVPRGIWSKKKRKSLLRKKRKIPPEEKENQRKINSSGFTGGDDDEESTDESGGNDAVDWDNEMWDRLGVGFWRSESRRKDD